jgi:transcriptional regulator with GAF, ATPase, and Fis domain
MPETNLGGVLCDPGDSAAVSASDPVCTGIHPELLFDEVGRGPYMGLLHHLSRAALAEDPAQTVVGTMLRLIARALCCNLACMVRQCDDELLVTRHSTRSTHALGGDVISQEHDPLVRPFMENGCPVVCDRVREACTESSFFRKGLSISAFTLLPATGDSERRGLLLTWRGAAPSMKSEHLLTLGSVAHLMGSVLMRVHLEEDLEHERESRRRYTKLVAGREVRMAELKSENAKLKDLVIELSRKIGELEQK